MDAMVCMKLVWKNQTINPFFDEFESKRTLLGILVVFWQFLTRFGVVLVWFCG